MNHNPFMLKNKAAALLLLMAALTTVAAACGDDAQDIAADDEQIFIKPDGDGSWILVDQIHTTKQNPDLKLERNNYRYQGMHGYHRLFKHFERNGYPYSQINYTGSERLTPEVLDGFKVLFINLVSSDRPDFTQDEITTIIEWVRGGGGLFMIADHTNVYYHAQRINPFLEPMGIKVTYHTALDQSPQYAIPGGAWLKIQNWDTSHPVSQGLEIASFQTGGPVESEHGVGFLSDGGFGDFWIENPEDPGFYGNWSRDEGEPEGALPVVAAAQFGQGRVAVVGDQNIFGDEWVMVAHNRELASNIVEWLAGNEGNPDALRDQRDPSKLHVGFPIKQADWNIGLNYCAAYFPFFINFNRTPDIVARGSLEMTGREDVMVFTDPSGTFTDAELATVQTQLDEGKTIVIVTDVTRSRAGTVQLLKEFVPDFAFQGIDGTNLTADNLPALEDVVETVVSQDAFPISSDTLQIEGMKMAGHQYPSGVRCPDGIEDSEPYMRRVTASFGTPFLQATLPDNSTVDLARRLTLPSGGQVIVFLQDGFWRNETLGKERQSPTPATADSHKIEYVFLDWLVEQKK